MSIFTRFKDIVGANINSMLDRAEDPEKLIRLMIREMEETLVELKAACASNMAVKTRIGRELDEAEARTETWQARAALAVEKGRDDLAREALAEKRRLAAMVGGLRSELKEADELIAASQEDIERLEEKLGAARDKQRMLIKRHRTANVRKDARKTMRKAESGEAYLRFARFEQQVERMEAEAEMEGPVGEGSLENRFRVLEGEEEIEKELDELKKSLREGK